jgi:hypothetical protein
MQPQDVSAAIAQLLMRYSASLSEFDVRREAKECRDGIIADDKAHGASADRPFFDFLALQNVAVFTFFESQFSIYIVPCNESQVISDTNRFAMSDTAECKAYLAAAHGKASPDFVLSEADCDAWLASG